MGLTLSSIFWELTKRTDTLDYSPNYSGTWKSAQCATICGEIELYLDSSKDKAQALIIYDAQSIYRAGWKVKIDLELQKDVEVQKGSSASTSISHSVEVGESAHPKSIMILSTADQKLRFTVLKMYENKNLSGSYVSSSPSDEGTWSVDLVFPTTSQ